jgi:hypothetical protein
LPNFGNFTGLRAVGGSRAVFIMIEMIGREQNALHITCHPVAS